MTNASVAAAMTLNANAAFVDIIRRKEVCAFNHIQEAEPTKSYKALEKAGFHFTDYYSER